MMERFKYSGAKLKEISFPLGGIGSGCVGLAGTGRLVDWEICNRPNKNSLNGFTHFAVKVEEGGRVVDARVLNSDLPSPYTGGESNYGFGPSRFLLAGAPHFRDAVFTGTYPVARIDFSDDTFPGQAALEAFNPMIPLDADASSLPVACFTVHLTNTTGRALDYVLAFSVNNFLPKGKRFNTHLQSGPLHLVRQQSTWADPDDPDFGELVFSVRGERVSWQEDWYRGSWFDSLATFWRDFTAPGDLKNRRGDLALRQEKDEAMATLTTRLTLKPGESGQARFVLAWYFPNATNYWNPEKQDRPDLPPEEAARSQLLRNTWKNYYAVLYPDGLEINLHMQENWDRLEEETRRFVDSLYSSSLPEAALEAVTANMSLLRSPTCLRLADGSFYGFEGCHAHAGCCEGSCTHVWNYAYALPFLYPALERSMRELDYRHNLRPTGEMPFRLQLPPGRAPSAFRACADGQLGGVVKVFRDHAICGDTAWLKRLWPAVKRSLEYAWSPDNPDRWDPDRQGVLTGRQHHTLDMELFGPNAWLTGIYLAALQAGIRLAEAVGDQEAAKEYREILSRGRAFADKNLFNGDYFIQKIDLSDRTLLDAFSHDTLIGKDSRDVYWHEEAGELKYQIGEGCAIDQVLGQWHCDLTGLGDVFDPEKVRSALKAIYRYNYRSSFRELFNPCRIYCLNDEAGTMICAWPEGRHKPAVPAPYSEETMHGFEYQAGSHMILRGMEEEGLQVVQAVRDRYDGEKRNPWNEFECGSNYARSMASFALLLAYSGFHCDMAREHLSFRPLHAECRPLRFFWSVDAAWGEIRWPDMGENAIELAVLGGCLPLRSLSVPEAAQVKQVRLDGRILPFGFENGTVRFERQLLGRGAVLSLT